MSTIHGLVFLPAELPALEEQVKEAEKAVAVARLKRDNALTEIIVLCQKCRAPHQIRRLTYMRQIRWDSSSDRYEGAGSYFDCPACKAKNWMPEELTGRSYSFLEREDVEVS